jgi:multiple sugar transport system permease protein
VTTAARTDQPDRTPGRPRDPVRRLLQHRLYNEYAWAYVFLLPALLIFAIFLVYPAIQSLFYSFDAFNPLQGQRRFIGLDNYVTLFRDPVWWTAIVNTLVFTIATVPFSIAVSLGIAVLLMPLHSRLQTIFKTVFYMPGVTSAVVIGMVWLWIFYPFSEGLANFIVESLGGERVNWLGKSATALPSIIFMTWLTGLGAAIVLYMAALGNIPSSIYEAADIDCAGSWTRFRKITWPLIKPTTLYAAIIGTAGSFLVFDVVYSMTKGGPGTATTTIVYRLYDIAFGRFEFGLASASAVLLALLVVGFSVIQLRFFSTDVEY